MILIVTTRIVLKWIPPAGFSGNVAFVATVVEKFASYWVGIQVSSRQKLKRIKECNSNKIIAIETEPCYAHETIVSLKAFRVKICCSNKH